MRTAADLTSAPITCRPRTRDALWLGAWALALFAGACTAPSGPDDGAPVVVADAGTAPTDGAVARALDAAARSDLAQAVVADAAQLLADMAQAWLPDLCQLQQDLAKAQAAPDLGQAPQPDLAPACYPGGHVCGQAADCCSGPCSADVNLVQRCCTPDKGAPCAHVVDCCQNVPGAPMTCAGGRCCVLLGNGQFDCGG